VETEIQIKESGKLTIRVLNAVEDIILEYGREHKNHIGNPYWYFADRLGYKSKNYLYRLIANRDSSKIGLIDVQKIIEITGKIELADLIYEELKSGIKK